MFWDILSYLAWGVSAMIFIYLLMDAIKVGNEFSDDVLMSSREGVDDLIDEQEDQSK